MGKILAFLGANSQIARDLIRAMHSQQKHRLLLYVRDVPAMQAWLLKECLTHEISVHCYADYDKDPHDIVLNFVGIGDPRRASEMGASIFEITCQYDDMALAGLKKNPQRRYLFISSGAVYGNNFTKPVNETSEAHISINAITPQNYYALAKLHVEIRHRLMTNLAIVDLRIFNYFSRTQELSARFFITDLLRAIRSGETVQVSSDFMVRDYLHPADFHQLIECILQAPPQNTAIDCYTAAPVEKPILLQTLSEHFGLRYKIKSAMNDIAINATGEKSHYYSLNRRANTLGYTPVYSSLSGVLEEVNALLT